MLKKNLFILIAGLFVSSFSLAENVMTHPATDAYDGWRLGVQAWTFNRYTFFDAIDKTAELGLDWIEAYPGQKISPDMPQANFSHEMPAELREQVKARLKQAGIRIANYGVVSLDSDEAKCRKVFDFAKDMGIETIVSEPPAEAFDLLDKLCHEYKINLAIHNHPKPSPYWNPDTVLERCAGRSKYIGACADTGHWVRSGLDPVECLKKLEGRIISLHFKEIRDDHDVIWGTGEGRVKPLLEELNRQKFAGVFSIEYEYNWENSMPEIAECIKFFDQTGAKMKPSGWHDLFASDLSNATFRDKSWSFEGAVLTLNGGGDIWTNDTYGDFVLDFEFKTGKDTNSGVFIRAPERTWLPWVEVQLTEAYGLPVDRHVCGGIYDVLAPKANVVKSIGQWNRTTITAKGSQVDVVMNGEHIINMNLDDWTTAHKNPDGSDNKFDIAYKDLPRSGYIGLQDHQTKVWFRNIKVKEL